tara:strand:+ start:19 stop:381 length:363 start_codon:yes stop_codon:yes gene_type:complete
MANDFKRYTKADCGTGAGASGETIYTVPSSGSAMETIVIGITLANTSTAGITGSVFIDNHDGSNDVYVVKNASIPAGSSLEVMAGNKLVLQGTGSANDILKVTASASSSLDATVSILEDV